MDARRLHLLIIAYGNELRGDDGAGPALGHYLERYPVAGATVVVRHQLVPELAENLSRADYAVFADARTPDNDPKPHLRRLRSRQGTLTGIGHVSDPGDLLAMTGAVYGRVPECWVLSLPTVSMEIGESLTPTARNGVRRAAGMIRRLAKRVGHGIE